VYLEVPRDMPGVPCAEVPPVAPRLPDAEAVAACADELLERLRAARQPVLMVGVEVRRHGLENEVAELARRLAVPVVTSFMGRGLLAGHDAPLHGTYLGLAGDAAVRELVESSDGLLLLGVIVSDTNFAVSSQRIDMRHTLMAIDDRVTMGHHVYPYVPLAALLRAMLVRLPPAQGRVAPPAPPPAAPAPAARDDEAVTPAHIAAALNAVLAEHGAMPIASDVGDCLFTAMDLSPTALVAPGYYATMGYGVPAGIGLQVAGGRRALVLVGDGAFQMTGWELGNAARAGCDPVVIVFNNSAWEMLRAFTPEAGFNALPRWDFASMAAGMGGDGHAVSTVGGLRRALATAMQRRGRFQLIDVKLAEGAVSPTLARFVAAVKRLSMPVRAGS
jgi:indolepyruvate decarboxylase